MAERNARVFEWLLLIVVIGIIVVLAVNVYTRMASDVQKLSFKLAAQNFETAVSGVRAEWYIQQSQGNVDYTVMVYGRLPGSSGERQGTSPAKVYLNRDGWPVNTSSLATAQDGMLEAWECMELWNSFLAQAPLTQLQGREPVVGAIYGISAAAIEGDEVCRYRHLLDAPKRQHFDYSPSHGRVVVNSSEK